MRIAAIIPARLASSRLPGKVLLDIAGKPMIQHVYERVRRARRIAGVYVATDDPGVERTCRAFGAEVVLTSPSHRCGTDRVAEAACGVDADVIVNVQADEPLIEPEALDRLAAAFDDPAVRMASVMSPLARPEDGADPNVVKVVCDRLGRALYFSRLPIPYTREASPLPTVRRHVGVYAYRRDALRLFVTLAPADLEQAEGLEQLRALYHGLAIHMIEVPRAWLSVDTGDDLDRVRAIVERHERP